MTKKKEREAMAFIKSIMQPHGMKCGNEILELAKKMHPNFAYGIPLYRSAVVVLKQTRAEKKRGACTIILYHDPHWMGQDLNVDNLPRYKEVLKLYGQRNGPDITRDGSMLTEEWHKLQDCAMCMESPYVFCPVCGKVLVPNVEYLRVEGQWSHLDGCCDNKKWPRMNNEFNMKSLLPFEEDLEEKHKKEIEEWNKKKEINEGGS